LSAFQKGDSAQVLIEREGQKIEAQVKF